MKGYVKNMSTTSKISELTLAQEIHENIISLTSIVGLEVHVDIGYGDFVPCRIIDIITVPVLNNPDEPDGGIKYTFHLVLQALEIKLNTHEYNNAMIYKITPLEDSDVFRMIEEIDFEPLDAVDLSEDLG